ncbi:hypothetical protein G6F70_009486 [Rhizopus microsporus]|nr:hypothetical protein G6F71_009510 [Rhizopus microsporus]KAG1188910.1 hypothetical protein G6F70_009486 [Rhizopus microsporus]KAG1205278.1 hypothetical protein G6F69_009460 [Rhizopus microsporus]KAG1224306.1 hypothetical protein G6F67_009529 [Rhizopus microsporus]KAG1248886.1 hypothetical protein G6F68_013613 [Rhizopus microsporus]
MQHEFCSRVYLFSITGEFTFRKECISLSTTEPRTSIRSLASSAALDKGIGIQDIVTLGNWASSDTFLQRYQRNHMADINFITTVLAHSGEDNEIFYDADEDWTLD